MSERSGRRARREFVAALAALSVVAVMSLLAAGRTWATLLGSGMTGRLELTGADLVPVLRAAGLVALAAVAALAATARWGRRLVGLLLGLVAVLVAAGSIHVLWRPLDGAAAAASLRYPGQRPDAVELSGWPWLGAAAGALLLAVSVACLVRGSGWPSMSPRYRRGAGRPAQPPAAGPCAGAATLESGRHAWERLDRGEDPTAG